MEVQTKHNSGADWLSSVACINSKVGLYKLSIKNAVESWKQLKLGLEAETGQIGKQIFSTSPSQNIAT